MKSEMEIYLQILKQDRDKLIKQFAKYDQESAIELKVLLRMIDKLIIQNGTSTKDEQKVVGTGTVSNVPITKRTRAVPIVKRIFAENQDTIYSPPDIRDVLQAYKNRGELMAKSQNTLSTAHSAIRVLVRQGFINRVIDLDGGDPTYRLTKKEKGLLDD